MFKICKTFRFEAAHHLPITNGKCKNVHGHNYKVKVYIEAETPHQYGPDTGMIFDFHVLDKIAKNAFLKIYDHKNLNEIQVFRDSVPLVELTEQDKLLYPTAELIAADIFLRMKHELSKLNELCCSIFYNLDAIRVYENDDCWAEYSE
jgi:6-pyruvoyltetrahydropterin/6-carboxytetrahydropterin synthase